jgi:AmmeMemoRadiSam system protein B
METNRYPKLRRIEISPFYTQEQRMICLHDPSGLATENLVLSQDALLLIGLLDGKHSILDIQAAFMRLSGELVFSADIATIIHKLDEHLFLENERFQNHYATLVKSFSNNPIRETFFTGKSYPKEQDALRTQIDQFFTAPSGPGKPEKDCSLTTRNLCGIVAPHIDFQRGGPCFAWAYKEIMDRSTADLFVIFGTSHQYSANPFVLTFKDFATPFGVLETRKDIVEKLKDECGEAIFTDEIVHRSEHSIEFQSVFLQYLFQGCRNIKAVPILCGSFHGINKKESPLSSQDQSEKFLKVLKEILNENKEEVCFIAGADLSHVGVRFGDAPLTSESLQAIEKEDMTMLSRITDLDVQGFLDHLISDGDRRKICGVPPIFALLKVMEASEGMLLRYEKAVEPDMSSMVSFASLAFYQ